MKAWLFAFVFLAVLGVVFTFVNPKVITTKAPRHESELQTVRNRVSDFALTFKMVSLLATSTLASSMDQYYASYVAPELLEKWKKEPMQAPGRLTSSPWPDHAEIDSIEKVQDGSYRVIINVVQLTEATTAPVGLQPIYMRLKNIEGQWKIVELQKDPYTED